MFQKEVTWKLARRSHMSTGIPASWVKQGRICHAIGPVECMRSVTKLLLGTNTRLLRAHTHQASSHVPQGFSNQILCGLKHSQGAADLQKPHFTVISLEEIPIK